MTSLIYSIRDRNWHWSDMSAVTTDSSLRIRDKYAQMYQYNDINRITSSWEESRQINSILNTDYTIIIFKCRLDALITFYFICPIKHMNIKILTDEQMLTSRSLCRYRARCRRPRAGNEIVIGSFQNRPRGGSFISSPFVVWHWTLWQFPVPINFPRINPSVWSY